jgi:hypothetical protein
LGPFEGAQMAPKWKKTQHKQVYLAHASASIGDYVDPSVRWLVRLSPYHFSAFFSAVCGWNYLKFGRDLHVDLLFQFLLFFFLNSSSNSSFSSAFYSEIEFVYIFIAHSEMDAFCLLTQFNNLKSNLITKD